MTTLEAKNLSVEYLRKRSSDSLDALRNVNFSVESGEFVAIVGPSGCGKTTLLNVFAGLVTPTSGEVKLNDQPIIGPGSDRAMVFQSASLLPWRTITRNISYGLELGGMDQEQAISRAQDLMVLVGLKGFEESFPHELSGGMQQRANLARALVTEPKILLMDEPLASLDAQTRETMQEELLTIWQKTGTTTVFVTHQIDEAIYLGDRVIVLSSRPGTVLDNVDISLPRPRPLDIKQQPNFRDLESYIWRLLRNEADKIGRN